MPVATSTVSIPAGDVVGVGPLVVDAVFSGEVVGAGLVTGTCVSGGVVMTKVCISTEEEPYG